MSAAPVRRMMRSRWITSTTIANAARPSSSGPESGARVAPGASVGPRARVAGDEAVMSSSRTAEARRGQPPRADQAAQSRRGGEAAASGGAGSGARRGPAITVAVAGAAVAVAAADAWRGARTAGAGDEPAPDLPVLALAFAGVAIVALAYASNAALARRSDGGFHAAVTLALASGGVPPEDPFF